MGEVDSRSNRITKTKPTTVVIPFCEDYTPRSMLDEAIESVEEQSVPTTIEIIEDTDQNGPAWARNQGLERAETRYVAFLDADDLWASDKLERQISLMVEKEVGLCVQGPNMDTEEFVEQLLFGSLESLTPSILIDTELTDVRFDEDLDRFEDHLFMIEAATQSGVCLCEDLVTVRKHDNGLSTAGSLELTFHSRLEMADRLLNNPETEHFARRCKQLAYYSYGRGNQLRGNHRKAISLLIKSLMFGLAKRPIGALLLSPLFLIRDLI